MASIEPYKTTKLNDLKINLVDTKATFQAMQQAEIVESNQLYFIEEKDVGSTVEYIVGTQTASTGSWTGVTKDSELTAGKVIAYKLPYAGSGNASLTLTFTNSTENNTSGAIPVYLNNTRVTTHYAANSVILMVYDGQNWRSTDYWNSNSRDAGYGKINITQSNAVTGIEPNTNQLAATTYNEAMTVTAGNKWIKLAGTNGASNTDVLTIGHSISEVTAGNYGDSTDQTPAYGDTFEVPYISVDAGGHITSISTHTVKIPASDNTNTATAADNILDGSNSGTKITYAPYTTQQSKLSFDTSTTAPTRTDRLNLNGYLYATKLYSGGNEVLTAHQTLPTATTSQKGLVQIGAGITINNGTISVTAANLGLSNAMHFIGVSTVEITDGSTTDPTISGSSYSTKTAGDVVLYDDAEFVWTGDNNNGHWELLGDANSFKVKQTVVTAPATETNKWISSIGQDANGLISANYTSLDTSGAWSGNAGSATKLAEAKTIQTNLASTSSASFNGSADITPGVTGILPVANGGTGVSSFTANRVVMSGTSTTANLTTRAVTNNTSNTAATASTNIPTMNTLFYTLAQINNANQTHATNVYAPTTAGTANQILVSAGGTSAPTWKATGNGAAYATSTNGELTFGTLPVAQGGTGKTTWTVNGLLYASAATTLASMVPAWENWGTGTTAGPTAKIQLGNKSYESSAIPSASASASGVVTTGAQTFAGAKTFNNKIILGGTESSTAAINFSRSGYNYITVPTGGSLAIGTDSSSASTWCKFTNGNILPERTEEISLGASDKKWANVYATKFNGEASNVTTTDSINSSTPLELIGVTSTATTDLKRKSLITMSTTTAGRAARIIFTDNAKVPINGDSNTTQTRKGWIGLNGDGTNFGVYSSTTGQTGYLVALTNDGTYQFGAGNISAKGGAVDILTSITSPTYITTSVSYGEESNRPSNPVEGQLYFQFID